MEKWDNMTNNEILMEIKILQANHDAIKLRMLKDYDELEETEKQFAEANKVIVKRLKGEK